MQLKSIVPLAGASILVMTGLAALAQSARHDSHIAIENPADLSKEEGRRIYDDLKSRMATSYALSDLPGIRDYQSWPILNVAPYVSATHGQRYVNNYVNETASGYATLQPGDRLPAGSLLLKDSITVTDDGGIFPGALFGMEKLDAGASPSTADWRYFMVIPDGSVFGDTTGANPDLMIYCHDCHMAVADRDYTFYIPESYRIDK